MKLLFDQNLSFKLIDALSDVFPNSRHVKMMGLKEADDREVWDMAKKEGYVIVSKDSDFHQFSFLYGAPPKIVWISIGNCSSSEIERILRAHKKSIYAFAEDSKTSFLEIAGY